MCFFLKVVAFDVKVDYEIMKLEFKCGTGDEHNEFAIYFGTIRQRKVPLCI